MRKWNGGEFFWHFVAIVNHWVEISFLQVFDIVGKLAVQVNEHIFGNVGSRNIRIQSGLRDDMFRYYRTDTGKACVDCFSKGSRFFSQCQDKVFKRNCERVQFRHRVRDEIGSSRKDFPDRTHLCGNMLNAVQNLIFIIAEDDIAVLAHDFYDQTLTAKVPQFI